MKIIADTVTWAQVASDAVKIGLGALVGGGFGVWLALLNNRQQVARDFYARKRQILEDVVTQFDKFFKDLTLFVTNLRNASYVKQSGEQVTQEDRKELEALEKKLFTSFTILASVSSRLLLLGEPGCNTAVEQVREKASEFFKIATLENPKLNEQAVSTFVDEIRALRTDFLTKLSEPFSTNKDSFTVMIRDFLRDQFG